MNLPRFRIRTMMLAVAAVAASCAVLPTARYLFPAFRSNTGGGGKDVSLDLLVVDQATGSPVAGADVLVRNGYRPDLFPPRRGRTGGDGRAAMRAVAAGSMRTITVEAEGVYRVVLWQSEGVSLDLGSVAVDAPGYRTARIPLEGAPRRSPITIRLRRAEGRRAG